MSAHRAVARATSFRCIQPEASLRTLPAFAAFDRSLYPSPDPMALRRTTDVGVKGAFSDDHTIKLVLADSRKRNRSMKMYAKTVKMVLAAKNLLPGQLISLGV